MNKHQQAPDHLAEITIVCDPKQVKYFMQYENWFEALTWCGQLKVDGESKFHLWHTGTKGDDGMLINNGEDALVIWVQPVQSANRILLFDERIHGYNAMLVGEVPAAVNGPLQQYADDKGESSFEVVIWTNSSIDFEDEFETNDQGKISCLDNTDRSIAELERNAFDYIGILIKHAKEEIRILDMELA